MIWRYVLLLLILTIVRPQNVFQRQAHAIRNKLRPSNRIPDLFDNFHRHSSESTRTTTTTTSTTTTTTKASGTLLVPPVPEDCAKRPKHWKLNDNWYFYSADEPEFQEKDKSSNETVGKRYDWLAARNLCRRFCMDSVSVESEEEWLMVRANISDRGIIYIWSSGRLCDFKGCETREDLKPLNKLGWFWSGTNVKISDTSKAPQGWDTQPWSQTGHTKEPQPDNAEYDINQTSESCLGLLNNIYKDGVSWHDIACYHKKPVFCEDSAVLLNYARAISQRDNLQLTIE